MLHRLQEAACAGLDFSLHQNAIKDRLLLLTASSIAVVSKCVHTVLLFFTVSIMTLVEQYVIVSYVAHQSDTYWGYILFQLLSDLNNSAHLACTQVVL